MLLHDPMHSAGVKKVRVARTWVGIAGVHPDGERVRIDQHDTARIFGINALFELDAICATQRIHGRCETTIAQVRVGGQIPVGKGRRAIRGGQGFDKIQILLDRRRAVRAPRGRGANHRLHRGSQGYREGPMHLGLGGTAACEPLPRRRTRKIYAVEPSQWWPWSG